MLINDKNININELAICYTLCYSQFFKQPKMNYIKYQDENWIVYEVKNDSIILAPENDEGLSKGGLVKIPKIEILADYQHQIWAHWMKYMLSKCRPQKLTSINHVTKQEEQFETGNYVIPKELLNRWIRQMHTDYADLTDREKQSDIDQVKKFIHLL